MTQNRACISEEQLSNGEILFHVMYDGKSLWVAPTRISAQWDVNSLNAREDWDGPMSTETARAITGMKDQ